MKFVREELKLFDFNPHAMRGKNFFEGVLKYRENILSLNQHRILKQEVYQCALCQGKEGTVLLEWKAGYQVIQCNHCDYATANFSIVQTEELIDQVYNSDLYYEKFLRETVAHFEYRKAQMGRERYSYIIDRLNLDPKNLRLLDVGCGAGLFLSYLQDRNIDCQGLEVNARAVRFCQEKGLKVKTGTLQDEPDEAYDIIVMFDVLEHLDDPIELISVVFDKLKPGGYLVAYTPNIHSVAYELMGSKQNTLLPFEHVGFFSERAFQYLAEQTGFEIYSLDVYGFDIMDYLLMKEYEDNYEYSVKLRDMMLLVQACLDRLRVANHFRLTLRKPILA